MIGKTHFVLVVEGQNRQTGLGARFGSWLLEAEHSPRYDFMGVVRTGGGGTSQQVAHQNLAPYDILAKIRELAK
jgi:hypothetical protein